MGWPTRSLSNHICPVSDDVHFSCEGHRWCAAIAAVSTKMAEQAAILFFCCPDCFFLGFAGALDVSWAIASAINADNRYLKM